MKAKNLVTGLLTVVLVLTGINQAEAHRWGRRAYCRPARVVVLPPRVIAPPVVIVQPRMIHPRHGRVCVPAPRVYRHHRNWR